MSKKSLISGLKRFCLAFWSRLAIIANKKWINKTKFAILVTSDMTMCEHVSPDFEFSENLTSIRQILLDISTQICTFFFCFVQYLKQNRQLKKKKKPYENSTLLVSCKNQHQIITIRTLNINIQRNVNKAKSNPDKVIKFFSLE